MTKEDEEIIEDVKFILRSEDKQIIKTLKVTIPTYLHCIEVNRKHAELTGKKHKNSFNLVKGGRLPEEK